MRGQPWTNEPDKLDFEHSGLVCAMRRGPMGHWCGYVGVPAEHPAHGMDYCSNELDGISVHGGLTWASGEIHDDKTKAIWWLGFDCAHHGDLVPQASINHRGDTYRNAEYVKAECESLADQLAAMVEATQ